MAAAGIENPEPRSRLEQRESKGEDWGDADSAGYEYVVRPAGTEHKIVVGVRDGEMSPRREAPHIGGTATRVRQQLHGDAIKAVRAWADHRI